MRTPLPLLTRRSGAALVAMLGLFASACSFLAAAPYDSAVATRDAPLAGRVSPTKDGPSRADKRPNIVMVMADDMRVDDLRFAPHIRKLIKRRGVYFANSFSPYPLCCPARASFLSGLYAHNHKVLSHKEPYGFGAFDDSFTVATALHRGGYNTGFVGKYLNNYGKVPSLVTGEPSWQYVPSGWTDWHGAVERTPGSPARGGTYNYFNTSFNVNGHVENGHKGEYQTNVLGRKTRRLISKYSGSPKPFFIYLSFVAPHGGAPHDEKNDPNHVSDGHGGFTHFDTPARPEWVKGRFNEVVRRSPGLPVGGGPAEANVSDKPEYIRNHFELSPAERRAEVNVTRQRAEAVFLLDRQVERVITRLKRTGEYRNTVIMFVSDNGYMLGEHRVRQGKVKPYEPSLRVPFMVAGRGIPRGEVRYDPIMTFDITATITDLANVQRRMASHHVPDGTSKLSTIRHGDHGWRLPVVTEAIIGAVDNTMRAQLRFHDDRNSIGIRTARYKYVRYASGEAELYDLAKDGNELHSVIDDPHYRRIRRVMARTWREYKDCAGVECREPLPRKLRIGPDRERRIALHQAAQMNRRYGVLPR